MRTEELVVLNDWLEEGVVLEEGRLRPVKALERGRRRLLRTATQIISFCGAACRGLEEC